MKHITIPLDELTYTMLTDAAQQLSITPEQVATMIIRDQREHIENLTCPIYQAFVGKLNTNGPAKDHLVQQLKNFLTT